MFRLNLTTERLTTITFFISALIAGFLFISISNVEAAVTTESVVASEDTYSTTFAPNAQKGGLDWIRVQDVNKQTHKFKHMHRGFVYFDLQAIDPVATVATATVRLYVSEVSKAGPVDIQLVTEVWDELSLTMDNVPDVLFDTVDSLFIDASDQGTYIEFDLTEEAVAWLTGSTTNAGIMLSPRGTAVEFGTKESGQPAELVLDIEQSFDDGGSWSQETAAAAWSGRSGHMSITYDNKMWVMGGRDDVGYRNDVWYSSDGVTWTEAAATANWSSRILSTALVYDNKMWIIGGRDGGFNNKNDVWYSSDGVTWTEATSSAEWLGRYWHSSVVYDNKMWVIGGITDGGSVNDVWYSSDGVTWTEATSSAEWLGRIRHTSVTFDNKMWVIGGNGGSDVWSSSDGITWSQSTASPEFGPTERHRSVVYDNKMWVIGGNGGSDVWSSSDGVTWTEVTSAAGWSGRGDHTSVVFDGSIWIAGGFNGSDLNDVWRTN